MNYLDQSLCNIVHKSIRTWGPIEYLMAVLAATFNNEILSFIWTLAIIGLPWSLYSFLAAVLLPVLTLFSTLILKRLVSRPRPIPFLPRVEALRFDFRGKETNHSMPSGDSAQAAAFWTFLALNLSAPWWLCFLMTLGTMFSRVYYMCHFPSDTIVGALVGSSIAFLVTYFLL